MLAKLSAFYQRHQRWAPILFFVFGFSLDVFTLNRIDDPWTLGQQAFCLVFAAILLSVELAEVTGPVPGPRIIGKVWPYREHGLQFLFGILLSSTVIFYFKSASGLQSIVFVACLAGVMIFNEFKRYGKSRVKIHAFIFSLCQASYFVALLPILLGFIGGIAFLISIGVSGLAFWLYYAFLVRRLPRALLREHLVAPFLAIHLSFAGLYYAQAIPPVPLSVSYLGIFHGAEKVDGKYRLTYTRPWWMFWQNGDQTFLARPGDVITCFARIFSPARFKEQLKIRWLLWDAGRGWLPADAIPLGIEGGRAEGFRAVTYKKNYQPGKWQVRVETSDGRVVGQLNFSVETDDSTDAPHFQTLEF